jgi:hypothetical protein
MRAYVLPDERLRKLAGRFVWLDIDTEKPRNAAFVEKFPIDVWPTLLVVSPEDERVVVRWAGTATAEQIERIALDGERALRAGKASRAEEALVRADRLLGERRHAEAAAAYREALVAGGPRFPARERASEATVQALGMAGDAAECARVAGDVLPGLAGASAARVAAQGLSCALELEDAGARAAAASALEPRARRALGARGVLADDSSWLYDVLSAARRGRGDEAGALDLARRWLAFLEREAARARTPLARSAFDGQRLQAALRAGEPAAPPGAPRVRARAPGRVRPADEPRGAVPRARRPADALAAARTAPSRVRKGRAGSACSSSVRRRRRSSGTVRPRATSSAPSDGEAMPEAARPEGSFSGREGCSASSGRRRRRSAASPVTGTDRGSR